MQHTRLWHIHPDAGSAVEQLLLPGHSCQCMTCCLSNMNHGKNSWETGPVGSRSACLAVLAASQSVSSAAWYRCTAHRLALMIEADSFKGHISQSFEELPAAFCKSHQVADRQHEKQSVTWLGGWMMLTQAASLEAVLQAQWHRLDLTGLEGRHQLGQRGQNVSQTMPLQTQQGCQSAGWQEPSLCCTAGA